MYLGAIRKTKVLIIGANGLVGSCLIIEASDCRKAFVDIDNISKLRR